MSDKALGVDIGRGVEGTNDELGERHQPRDCWEGSQAHLMDVGMLSLEARPHCNTGRVTEVVLESET